jgi:hypothetical protein
MATTTSGRNVAAELAYLTRTLKAPSLAAAVQRLAERARAESWTHEEFLAACLQREVAARESHGGEARIRAARFPARKLLDAEVVCQLGHASRPVDESARQPGLYGRQFVALGDTREGVPYHGGQPNERDGVCRLVHVGPIQRASLPSQGGRSHSVFRAPLHGK